MQVDPAFSGTRRPPTWLLHQGEPQLGPGGTRRCLFFTSSILLNLGMLNPYRFDVQWLARSLAQLALHLDVAKVVSRQRAHAALAHKVQRIDTQMCGTGRYAGTVR